MRRVLNYIQRATHRQVNIFREKAAHLYADAPRVYIVFMLCGVTICFEVGSPGGAQCDAAMRLGGGGARRLKENIRLRHKTSHTFT